MFACRLLVGFALATVTSNHYRAADPVPAPKPFAPDERIASAELGPVARGFYADGRYAEALAAYTRWTPRSFCANCAFAMRDQRFYRIAFCYLHLGDSAAAARACLEAAGEKTLGDTGAATLTVLLYREAGQLNDLGPLLDAVEERVLRRKHPKPWLLTPQQRAEQLVFTRVSTARHLLRPEESDKLAAWPAGVPKPKPGSLPKTLPK